MNGLACLTLAALVCSRAFAGESALPASETQHGSVHTPGTARACIVQDGDTVWIKAGVLERAVRVSGGKVLTERLTINGKPLLDAPAAELSLQISRATPNRNPLKLLADNSGEAVVLEESEPGVNDAIEARKQTKTTPKAKPPEIAWTDARTFTAASWDACFDLANVTIATPQLGTQRVVVHARSGKDPMLAGVSIILIYEVYDGYPVIRKWVKIQNRSANWIKLDNLLTDDLTIGAGLGKGVPLTPSERGATASLVAFSHTDNTTGVIVASEIPSALRLILDHGAAGYNPEHFEWVLGPAEDFVSEPTFLYGFSGEVIKTPSAPSLPLDRAVEGRFKDFLRKHLGISPTHMRIQAPQWATWSNFGPKVTDAIVREQAEIAARCGFVLFELDDGWQQDRLGLTPNSNHFPDLAATCAYVRSLGLQMGLWVSCFRSQDAEDFKVLPDAASVPEVRRLNGVAMSFASPWYQYYANDLLRAHREYGVTYFKQDFTNIKFGDLAAGHYSRTRKESLLRGLRGLLNAQCILRKNAPTVANQITHEIYWGTPGVPCDLAALKVSLFYHIPPNDYSGVGHSKQRVGVSGWERYNPKKLRQELIQGCLNARERFYAHRGLPLECIEYYGAATVNWKGSLTPEVQDRQVCSWLMGAPLLYAGDLASLTGENITHYRKRFDLLKRLEETYGIYRRFQYSGVPEPTDTDWHWWGKLNEKGLGAVVVLRGSKGAARQAIHIPWVDPEAEYKVTALFQNMDLGTFTGAQLQAGKPTLALPCFGQEILELSPSATPAANPGASPAAK